MSSICILLAILGAVLIGVSIAVFGSSKTAMLGIILGGALLQAGIILFALTFDRERPQPRKRQYGSNQAKTAL